MKKSDSYLLLKWGTIKGWNISDDAQLDLLREIIEYDHPDADRKEKICKLIDMMAKAGHTIRNDWSGEIYKSAKAAKKYIMEYDE